MNQFKENLGIMTNDDLDKLKNTRVLLVGLGGLGGYVANSLVRLGVGKIILVDYDIFDISNLNRQLFSAHEYIGQRKSEVISSFLKTINPEAHIRSYPHPIESLSEGIYKDIDIIIDAVDNISSKCHLETMGKAHNKPLLHGSIGGWYGQLGIIMPGADILHSIYKDQLMGVEKIQKSPTFTPGIIANMMVAELIKFITHKDALINEILMIDLLKHDYQILIQENKKKE